MKGILILSLALSMTYGCAKSPLPSDLSQEDFAVYSKMTVYMKGQKIDPGDYTAIAPVEGVDCKRNAYQTHGATQTIAFESMKAAAAKLGASAIVNVECVDEGTSWSRNCWQTQVCRGMAIK